MFQLAIGLFKQSPGRAPFSKQKNKFEKFEVENYVKYGSWVMSAVFKILIKGSALPADPFEYEGFDPKWT